MKRFIVKSENDESGWMLSDGEDRLLVLKKESLVIQSLVFDKKKFTPEEAAKWVKTHGFKVSKEDLEKGGVDAGQPSIRVRQRSPGDFKEGSFRTFRVTDGVQAVGGKLKPGIKKGALEDIFLAMLVNRFGPDVVEQEVLKFEIGMESRLPSERLTSSLAGRENKEIFDGVRYLNIAPGKREQVTEGNVSKTQWERSVSIKKTNDEKQIVIGEVYVPYDPSDQSTIDTQDMAATAEAIEKAAYGFMEAMNLRNIDKQHNFKQGYGFVVESYIAKSGDPVFKEGTWVMGVKVTDSDVWSKIKKGEITGFSLAGSARLTEV